MFFNNNRIFLGFVLVLSFFGYHVNAMLSSEGMIDKQTSLSCAADSLLGRFDEFNYICKKFSEYPEKSMITWQGFVDLLDTVCMIMRNEITHSSWVAHHAQDPLQRLSNGRRHVYAQARVVPSNTRIVVMSDYHGSVHSLIRNIEYMKYDELLGKSNCISSSGILAPNVILVFLGDLADRGHYGLEMWVLALLLKLKNPHNVFLLRGNHEDLDYVASNKPSGFNHELAYKLSSTEFGMIAPALDQSIKSLCDAYFPCLFGYLPQVLFLGTHGEANDPISFLMFCHGGLALRSSESILDNAYSGGVAVGPYLSPMDFHPLLDQACQQPGKNVSCLSKEELYPSGFLWDGFVADACEPFPTDIDGYRGCDKLVQGSCAMHYLQTLGKEGCYSVAGIVRGHDHFDYGVSVLRAFDSLGEYRDLKKFWNTVYRPVDCCYDEWLKQFPIFTVTSFAEQTHVDAYALASFNPTTKIWQISPRINKVPVQLCEVAPIQSIDTCWKNKKYNVPLTKEGSTKPVFIPYDFSVNNINNIINKEVRGVPIPGVFLLDKSGRTIFSPQWQIAENTSLVECEFGFLGEAEYESGLLNQAETVKCYGICNCDMVALVSAAQHVKNLYLFDAYKELTDSAFGLLFFMQELSYLYIGKGNFSDATLFFLEKAPVLKSLVLDGRVMSEKSLQWLVESPSLEDVTIRGFGSLSSNAVALLLHMKHIKKITIESCPLVKKDFFSHDQEIASCCPTLEEIIMDGETIYPKSFIRESVRNSVAPSTRQHVSQGVPSGAGSSNCCLLI